MMSLTLEELRMAVEGDWLFKPVGGVARGISTDTREISPGELFVALEGDNHDGHDYVADALDQDACGAVVHKIPDGMDESLDAGLILVDDTLKALGDLGEYYRNMISARIIGITGSHGKSTTKEIISQILSDRFDVSSSPKSYNNRVGVPLSLFRVTPGDDYAVLEIGTNQPGDIDRLAEIAKPDIAVLTNITGTHLEGLKTIEGVQKEKGDLLHHLTGNGTVVYNRDNRYVEELIQNKGLDGVSYGLFREADLMATDVSSTMDGLTFRVNDLITVEFPLPGAWNVYNALAGLAVAREAGVPLEAAADLLSGYKGLPMRMQFERVNDVLFLNDAYNSNPRSVRLVLDEMEHWDFSGRKILVLGDMEELGEQSEDYHKQVGKQVADLAGTVAAVHFVGPKMQAAADEIDSERVEMDVYRHDSTENAVEDVRKKLKSGDLVVLKGSRKMKLEEISGFKNKEETSHQLQKN